MSKSNIHESYIKTLRKDLIIHSYIYYVLYDSIISDSVWDYMAMELVKQQEKYGTQVGYYDDVFSDWTGETGMHLPKDEWVEVEAKALLEAQNG